MKAAFVMPCYDERRAVIEAELKRRAAALDAAAIMPEDLLEEVTALTEWPVIYESQFESEFRGSARMSHSYDAAQPEVLCT